MNPGSSADTPPARDARFDWSVVWPWALGFGLTVYLGLNGGGFDPLVNDQVGLAVWWVLLFTVAVGALPRRRLGPLAWCALGVLAGLVVWTALSLGWTESTEKTAADLARVTTYLGVFALALCSRDSKSTARMVAAVASGIVLVGAVGLLSRLHPAWFPEAGQTAKFLTSGEERLSYPLDYWNGLAALVAIGLPLLLQLATGAKRVIFRALAAAAMPAMILTIFFTLSRGGIVAAVIALAVFVAMTSDRVPKSFTLLLVAIGGGTLIALANGRDQLVHGHMNSIAHSQGNEMIVIVIVVCALVGMAQAGASIGLAHRGRPRWSVVTRRQSRLAILVVVVLGVTAAATVNAPGRISHAWDEFKRPSKTAVSGTGRLGSTVGESRYQFWSSAVREARYKPLTGTGSGTFQLWWTRDADIAESVVDTHSLYLQTLGELGVVGFALLAAFLTVNLIGGGRLTLRASPDRRSPIAAALAGSTVLWITSLFDWTWKLPVIPIASLLLVSTLVTVDAPAGADPSRPAGQTRPQIALRVTIVVLALVAIAAIAVPLASTTFLRRSQSAARDGSSATALEDARTAQNAIPGAAGPRLQEALLLESSGEFATAAASAHAATDREPENWRNWLVLSRIEAERGRAGDAVRDYGEARSLNPLSPVFVH